MFQYASATNINDIIEWESFVVDIITHLVSPVTCHIDRSDIHTKRKNIFALFIVASFSFEEAMKLSQLVLLLLLLRSEAFYPTSTRPLSTRTTTVNKNKNPSPVIMQGSLDQYAPQAVSLFQNMITPASIIAGAIVPMAFASPLPIKSDNPSENRRSWVIMRKAYNVAALLSLLSNLLAVMWSVIAVNQLTETKIAQAESVWHLLRRDFDLSWYVI